MKMRKLIVKAKQLTPIQAEHIMLFINDIIDK